MLARSWRDGFLPSEPGTLSLSRPSDLLAFRAGGDEEHSLILAAPRRTQRRAWRRHRFALTFDSHDVAEAYGVEHFAVRIFDLDATVRHKVLLFPDGLGG